MKSYLENLLKRWKRDPSIISNIEYWETDEERAPLLSPFPENLHPALISALHDLGLTKLYDHQTLAYNLIQAGNHIVISTGTASGKTLCYNLPVINYTLINPLTTALYIFPTKALANDQKLSLEQVLEHIQYGKRDRPIRAGIYDGDTQQSHRSAIRNNSNVIFTNPDMLHNAILPHHTLWENYFRNLRFVVIDELHTYRGVFGSHVANVIRRLKRILHFYGAFPWFILTSATIGNPKELAQSMIEEPVTLIDSDGSPRCRRHFMIYNPPITDPDLGLRKSASSEAVQLAGELISSGMQTILFTKTRRGVEIILRNLMDKLPEKKNLIRGYRSGYLASERRAIENGLRDGEIRGVIATNALELGVDIGGMEAAVMVGYPGTIASTRQQAGRAGRRTGSALAILTASSSPLDQFLVKHPEFIVAKSPERALINPNNLLILFAHLQCAAFELPINKGDHFGNITWEQLEPVLALMEQSGTIVLSGPRYFWIADKYPSEQVSLRSSSGKIIQLVATVNDRKIVVGEIDEPSASWMIHPGAIYLHEDQTFRVEALDYDRLQAELIPESLNYYTEAIQNTQVELVAIDKTLPVAGATINCGEIQVTSQVTGFRKISWLTHEILGTDSLDMPANHLRTMGFWLTISEDSVNILREMNLWSNDPNNYGSNWNRQRLLARQRDHFTCQVCGIQETTISHHVHHKIPFKTFRPFEQANALNNLVTLCPNCHRKVEMNVRIQSGLAGLSYVLSQLAPLFLMCDVNDLGVHTDPTSPIGNGQPTIVIYDRAPAGIGLSDTIYQLYPDLINQSLSQVEDCSCTDGCPSCVGPSAEGGSSGKTEVIALLKVLNGIHKV